MSNTLEMYRAQAAKAQADADAATLENVRERCQRSATAWAEMAERAERVEKLRVGRSG